MTLAQTSWILVVSQDTHVTFLYSEVSMLHMQLTISYSHVHKHKQIKQAIFVHFVSSLETP